MKRIITTAFAALTAFAAFTQAQNTSAATRNASTKKPRRVALVVQNHAAPGVSIPMMALTDAITAKLAGRGFHVVNPYNSVGVNQNRDVRGEKTPEVSAMELARKLGAQGAVTASVIEVLDSTFGTPPTMHQYSLRMSLSLADARSGAAVCGETVYAESPKYTNNQVAQNKSKYLGNLMYAVAEECASRLEKKADGIDWEIPEVVESEEDPFVKRKYFDSTIRGMADEIKSLRSEVSNLHGLMEKMLEQEAAKKKGSGELSLLEIDKAVQEMMMSMRQDANFMLNYDKAKNDMKKLPMVVVGLIKDETEGSSGHPELGNLLATARVDIRVMLFKSALFDVKEDEERVALAKRIIDSGNSPLEDKELMAALKRHGSPDFYCVGDLRYFKGSKVYRLRIAMHSLWTGKIVWEDTVDIDK